MNEQLDIYLCVSAVATSVFVGHGAIFSWAYDKAGLLRDTIQLAEAPSSQYGARAAWPARIRRKCLR